MPTIDKEISVNAPLEKIFSYVSKPSNLLQIWPSLIEIKNEQLLPNGCYDFEWVYKMTSLRLEGTGSYVGLVQNSWFTVKTKGALDSTITWTFRSKDIGQTRVTFTIDYRVPLTLLSWLARITVVKVNEQEAELIMTNLRTRFETGLPEN
jgi:ligand-binding SRPBCC domain-containing protein